MLAPALTFDISNLSVGGQGSWTIFESGNQIFQGTAAAAWLAPPREWWRVELSGSVGASKYADEPGNGHFLARTRIHFYGERTGGWVSGTGGGSFGGVSSGVPFELAVGGWSVRDRVALAGTVTGTWLSGDGYMDLLGAVRWTGPRVELEGRLIARPWARSGEGVGEARTGVFGDASVLVALNERITLSLGGGSYPSDPMRRVLAAKYATIGLRLNVFGSQRSPVPTITGALLRAARRDAASGDTSPARLEIPPYGRTRALRVHVDGATSVELMGDFTDWQVVALAKVGSSTWETTVVLAPGVYRVNVRVNGGAWQVPAGSRREQTEFGGAVGVVVVP